MQHEDETVRQCVAAPFVTMLIYCHYTKLYYSVTTSYFTVSLHQIIHSMMWMCHCTKLHNCVPWSVTAPNCSLYICRMTVCKRATTFLTFHKMHATFLTFHKTKIIYLCAHLCEFDIKKKRKKELHFHGSTKFCD